MEKSNKYNYELIEDYLNGLLDTQTSRQVESLIKTDEIARDIAKGIILLKEKFTTDEAVENYLNDRLMIQNNLISQKTRRSQSWLKIAAAILILAVSGLVIFKWSGHQSTEELITVALEDQYPMVAISRSDDLNDNFIKAISAYEAKDYSNALLYFSSDERDQSTTTKFYQNLCHLYLGKFDQAIGGFSSEELQESRFSAQSQWFLAITYYKVGDKKMSEVILREIASNPQQYKSQEALKLLDSME